MKGKERMKPRFVIVMLLVLALALPATMLAQGSKDEQQIRAVGRELTEAFLKGGAEGAAVLDKIYAEDYLGVRGDGKVLTKAQEIEAYKTGAIKYQANESKEVKIRAAYNITDCQQRIYTPDGQTSAQQSAAS
jgi:hypothetical protein